MEKTKGSHTEETKKAGSKMYRGTQRAQDSVVLLLIGKAPQDSRHFVREMCRSVDERA